ncbi:septal ring lytic transglycosylase RlpA family protein [Alphaproteobacteria bacterium]|nr:septal ring lytic transglycosylase RlpA family protein [Alphaproteobacteria bacterium]
MVLASCAETRLVFHAAKKLTTDQQDSTGTYKVGKAYQIGNVWYYPKVNYAYSETGIASWYGPKFHNRETANGQIFDMNAISAAHRTLPMPSIVQVTNLKNGRSLKVLVNDRGPFAHGRIIDLSRRAAQLLGFERAGTARVRVAVIADESRRLARLAQSRRTGKTAARPSAPVKITRLGAGEDANLKIVPVLRKTTLFVQAGAFIRRDLAKRMEQSLAQIGPTQIVEATLGKRRFFRVRVGPVATVHDGDRILDAVVRTGYPGARLVVD